jgi:thiol-disulfide isomerase/thioredoxin
MQDAGFQEPAPAVQPGVIRTRVIPIVAGVMVVGLIGLLAWALFAPESLRELELLSFDGEPFRLSEQRGKVTVLNFWASWCEPCVSEMPMLNRIADEFSDDDMVQIIGVNVWDTRSAAERFIDDLHVTYPVIEDDTSTSIAVEFGLTGVPETFVINAEGEIVTFFRGEFSNAQQIRDMIALAR